MSDPGASRKPVFTPRVDDLSRAAPVDITEFGRLVSEMDLILGPLLQHAARIMEVTGFSTVRTECRDGSGAVLVQCPVSDVDAWLRFQVHRTFAILVPPERIFWMYSIFKAGSIVAGKPGRLKDFTDTQALSAVVSDFILDCLVIK